MFISKESYGDGEPKIVIAVSVQKTHSPLRASKLPGFKLIAPNRADNGNLGATYLHGTVFASKECLYQKEATGMGSLKL